MANEPLTPDSEFVVGEEKILNYVLALLFFALFAYGVIDAARRHFVNIDYQSYIFAFAILPAIYAFKRGRSNRIYIRINKTGIYHHGQLVTNWPGVVNIYLTQKEKTKLVNIQDHFQLIVEFRKEGITNKGFRKIIPLTNTQNKSEEDVLAAANYFWKNARAQEPKRYFK